MWECVCYVYVCVCGYILHVCVCMDVVVINSSTIICWHFMTTGGWAVSWNYPKDAFAINLQFNFYFHLDNLGKERIAEGERRQHEGARGLNRFSKVKLATWLMPCTHTHATHTRIHSPSQRLTCCMWQQTVATLFACSLYSFCARNNCIKFTKHATQVRGSERIHVNVKTQQSPTMLSKMRTNSRTFHICNAKLNIPWLINNNLTRLKSSKTI